MRRWLPLAAVLALTSATPAQASVSVTTNATQVDVTSAGTADKPTVSVVSGNLTVSDASAATGACTFDSAAHVATCPLPSRVVVSVGANNDEVTIDDSVTIPTNVTLGDGSDLVSLGGSGNDTVNAGTNLDADTQDVVSYAGRSG